MKRSILFFLLLLEIAPSSFAQNETVTMRDSRGVAHRVELHPQTGSARWIHGPDINITALGLRAPLDEQIQSILLDKLLGVFGDILQITPDQAQLRKADTDGTAWFVSFDQVVDGVPVVGTEIGYTIDTEGNVVALGATVYHDIRVSTKRQLSKDTALAAAREAFAVDSARVRNDGMLKILPIQDERTTTFHLAWQVRLFSLTPLKDITYFIDAGDGTVLREQSNMRHLHEAKGEGPVAGTPSADSKPHGMNAGVFGGTLSGTVTGSYYPKLVSDTPVSAGFKTTNFEIFNALGQRVAWGSTNSDGSWSTSYLASANYTIRIPLQNDWVELHDLNDNAIVHDATIWVGSNTTYNHSWAADDAPNVRYHVGAMHDFFKGSPFTFSGTDYQMNAFVDQGIGVNAAANGTEVFFGTLAGAGWARSSDVVNHEYTHNVIFNIYGNDFIGTVTCNTATHESCAMDEGLADYFAGAKNNDPYIGEDVGISRNLDNNTFVWTAANGNHWNGQVIGGAMWDVRQAIGDATIGNNLTFKALQITPHAFDFAAFRTNVIAADNLYYSGAHVCAIQNAFNAHGIGAACQPPPAAPTNLTVTGNLGQHPYLTWTGSTGATGYKVYRCSNWSYTCSSFSYIGSTTSTSYTDLYKTIGNGCVGSGDDVTQYQVTAYNSSSESGGSNTASTCTDPGKTGGPSREASIPEVLALHENYPNPFNPATEIHFDLPEAGHVRLVVYDLMGREVARLVDGQMEAGYRSARWNAADVPSGVYLYRLTAGQFTATKRMILQK